MDKTPTTRTHPLLPNTIDHAPAAIAFSGGGDSTAMIHAGRDHPKLTHAFIVDHALREGSAEEANAAARIAQSFGYQTRIIRWQHDGFTAGIQAKARAFRYKALGELCREIGIKHLLTAHTADDQAETLLMRLDRQTGWRGLAGMPAQAYAPLWPALAGVTLHRPWLHCSRRDLRDYNKKYSLRFIDDPSNKNTDFTRIRARQALAADSALRADLLSQQKDMRLRLTAERQAHGLWLSQHAKISPHNFVETHAVPPAELLLHILNSVSGRGGPIDAAKRARLCRDMESPDFKSATLAGAWVIRQSPESETGSDNSFVFLRDRVAVTGRTNTAQIEPLRLERDVQTLWDGRFFCRPKREDVTIKIGLGYLQKLRQYTEFNTLFDLPKEVRESLPIVFHDGTPVAFGACDNEFIETRATSASRLQALFKKVPPVSI